MWTILVLCLAELLSMAVWFSASAVVPLLAPEWKLSVPAQAWLTMSVQAGFAGGTLVSALLNLADRISARWLFAGSALLAAAATALIPVSGGIGPALALRIATGFFLAGVYPVGMKIMATWTRRRRGFGLGLLVGALTFGSAAPHWLRAYSPLHNWQAVLYGSAALAAAGALIAAVFLKEGPYRMAAPPFHWRYAGELFSSRDVVLTNLGYLGHMWELYAMWAWAPVFLLVSFRAAGMSAASAGAAAFWSIAAGGAGCVWAGGLSDRFGRCAVTIGSLLVSGACALTVGWLGGSPWLLTAVCAVWGFAVVADSAQYSACITELCRPEYAGTALTLQTCLGFLLTLWTIRLVPSIMERAGWPGAFAFLAIGPAVGVVAMALLRRSPGAVRLAGGRR